MPAGDKVLVVEDDAHISRLMRGALTRAGYQCVEASTARLALSLKDIEKPSVVLLDLGLPDRDGLELIQTFRASGAAVIVVSAREETAEKVAALDLGADDYVTKPFDTEEMLARVRAARRRRLTEQGGTERVRIGSVEIDLLHRRIRRDGVEVHVAPKEYGVLALLSRHPDRVISHAQLLREVWGPAQEHQLQYLRIVVRSLRQKLEAEPANPRLILNEPGVGYRLAAPTGEDAAAEPRP